MDRGLVCSWILYLHWLTQAPLSASSFGVDDRSPPSLRRFRGTSLSHSCSDTCLLAFLAFLALLVLWTLHSRSISISILPFPLPSGPTSLPFALQNSLPVYLLLARALMSLYAPSLLFSSFFPSSVLSRYHCLVSIPTKASSLRYS